MDGDYEGVIADVQRERMRNKWNATSSDEPVIHFLDGKRLVLNKAMLMACIEFFGEDSSNWIARRVRVFLKTVETRNRETGKITISEHRAITCVDPFARASVDRASGPCVRNAPGAATVAVDEIPWDGTRDAPNAAPKKDPGL
jgi:hypothetical protein